MRRAVLLAATAYGGAVLLLSAIHLVAPQAGGPLALTQILAPHLFVPLGLTAPLVLLRDARLFRVVVLAAIVVFATRFGDGLVSFPPNEVRSDRIVALSWNLERGRVPTQELVGVIAGSGAQIVALQELTPEAARALESDPRLSAAYPYQRLVPRPGVTGIGILSGFPISSSEASDVPAQRLSVSLSGGAAVSVVNAHPLPGRIRTATPLRIPYDFEPSRRDADIASIRAWIDEAIRTALPLLVLGDFNVTDREPAYVMLSAGLRDAHREVGLGTGGSWRPDRLDALPIGLLRIDYAFSAGGLTPVRFGTDCTPRGSDHCLLRAEFALSQ